MAVLETENRVGATEHRTPGTTASDQSNPATRRIALDVHAAELETLAIERNRDFHAAIVERLAVSKTTLVDADKVLSE